MFRIMVWVLSPSAEDCDTRTFVFVVSSLSLQYKGVRVNTGCLGTRRMSVSRTARLLVDCCFQ